MSLSHYRLCVFTWQKIDQAGGPETLCLILLATYHAKNYAGIIGRGLLDLL